MGRVSRFPLWILVGALCLAMPVLARAADEDLRLVDPSTGVGIRWYALKKNEYVFFLPSGISTNRLQVSLPEDMSATLDGHPLKDGDSAAGFTVEIGKGKNPLDPALLDSVYGQLEEMMTLAAML